MPQYLTDPKAAWDDIKKTGVYTVYVENRLEHALAVINSTNRCIQYLFDEKSDPVKIQRRYNDGSSWSSWVNLPLP